jgi:uncharacterized protein (DUF58 family)
VTAAEAAALGAWRVFLQGDRVGGLVFNDERTDEVRPHRSRDAVMRLLETVSTQNRALGADARAPRASREPRAGRARAGEAASRLDTALDAAARVATHDFLVVIVSDFDGQTPATRDLLLRLAAHNDVIAVLVYDPFLLKLPAAGDLVITDGGLQAEIDLGASATRDRIAAFAEERGKAILGWRQDIGIAVLPLSAAEDTAAQIRRLMGARG